MPGPGSAPRTRPCAVGAPEASPEERAGQERLAQLDAWLAKCDKVAELWEGEFDAAIEA